MGILDTDCVGGLALYLLTSQGKLGLPLSNQGSFRKLAGGILEFLMKAPFFLTQMLKDFDEYLGVMLWCFLALFW
jgi:hypothetical protein